jgi:microcystin degradation protein MlrC
MVAATDAIVAYSTNPHLDQRETGLKAAEIMAGTLSGEILPVQAAVHPPMAINIQSQNTAVAPLSELYDEVEEIAHEALSASIVLGFPYADVSEMGSSVLVVTDGNQAKARELSARIADRMFRRRHQFEPAFTSPFEAAHNVLSSSRSPVVLLDMGDNVGGGAMGDSTALLHECRMHGIEPVFACLCDPKAVQEVIEAGPGSRLENFAVGDPGNPFAADFVVHSLHGGRFEETTTRHGGFSTFDQGATVILQTSNGAMTIMLTSQRVPPFSLRQLTAFGVEPTRFRVLIAKGVIAPIAAYAPVAAGGFVHVDTPGPTRADMTRLDYRNRRRPMFPFENVG